ncbi:S8 family serine peptidase [Streptomyces sp. NPDC002659]|uniref:S8 family serine peptidase n=1 Tax=Streptomyces sp. NPDC002659 TaxID=3364656 RepID=UPI0036858056
MDATGHGTWCAGIIAAADNRTGITGIAAEAELHALKLFPRGRVSDLLQAVDYFITHDIGLAQVSLAYPAPSQLVALKLLDPHSAGIAVIAPAGDTAGQVTHPAVLPGVLSVGAIAHTGTHPPGGPFAAVQPPWPGPYPAPFTPVGPGVDLVAPGAAVITTELGEGYTAADGTAGTDVYGGRGVPPELKRRRPDAPPPAPPMRRHGAGDRPLPRPLTRTGPAPGSCDPLVLAKLQAMAGPLLPPAGDCPSHSRSSGLMP